MTKGTKQKLQNHRRKTLKQVLKTRYNGYQKGLAQDVKRPQTQISNWLSGAGPIGDVMARHIESSLGLEKNFLDGGLADVHASMVKLRVRNLSKIMDRYYDGSQSKLAAALKRTRAGVNTWITGKLDISDRSARTIEKNLQLPKGSLDGSFYDICCVKGPISVHQFTICVAPTGKSPSIDVFNIDSNRLEVPEQALKEIQNILMSSVTEYERRITA